jgi:hypothetical protein
MAGPSVMVRVLGDVSGLAKTFKESGDKAESAAKSARAAFGSMIGMLNQSGVLGPFGEALANANEAMNQIAEHGKKVSDVMLGAGGSLVAVGGLFSVLGSKEQAAHQQLAQAIENTGHSYEDYGKNIEEAIKHNERFGQSSEATQNALQVLTQATGDPAKALQDLNVATDLAAAKHEDLVTAATAVGKVYNGNTKLLKEFGIAVTNTKSLTSAATSATRAAQTADDNLARAKRSLADIELVDSQRKKLTLGQQIQLRNAQEAVTTATTRATEAHQKLNDAQTAVATATRNHVDAVTQLSDKLHGQAAAAADTFTGHLKAIKTEVEDQAAKFGQKYGPALQGAGAAMTGLGTAIKLTQAAVEAFTTAEEAATTATEAAAAAEVTADAAGLPLIATVGLIGAAVAALGVAAYEIYTHWSTIWAGMKAAAVAVWDWIRTNWPLLLAVITGPVGLAVLAVVRYWDTIKNTVAGVFNWIKDNWPLLLAVITGPFGLAVLAIVNNWNSLVDFFAKLPGRIAAIASTMWTSIYTNFKAVMDQIANFDVKLPGGLGVILHLGSILGGVSTGKIPGTGIKIPGIPHLAQGGLITADGLVYAHKGEAITPAGKTGGPAVMFTGDNHFSSEVDIDLFMRRAAWAVQTSGI